MSLTRRRRRDLQVAPPGYRFAASLIDALVGILVVGLVGGTGAAVFLVRRKGPADRGGLLRSSEEGGLVGSSVSDGRDIAAKVRSPRVKLALHLCAFAVSVHRDGRRSPGARIVGIRLVDARTGARVSRRQAIIRVATRRVWQALTTLLIPAPRVPQPPDHYNLRADIEAARREHADDQEAFQRAVMRIYGERRVKPVRVSCLPLLIRLPLRVAIDAPVLWSPLKQGLPDQLAGTLVILDR